MDALLAAPVKQASRLSGAAIRQPPPAVRHVGPALVYRYSPRCLVVRRVVLREQVLAIVVAVRRTDDRVDVRARRVIVVQSNAALVIKLREDHRAMVDRKGCGPSLLRSHSRQEGLHSLSNWR